MADFFTRLAERARGVALTIEPLLVSMYEPGLTTGEDTLLEEMLDEPAQQGEQSVPLPGAVLSTSNLPQFAVPTQSSSPLPGSAKVQLRQLDPARGRILEQPSPGSTQATGSRPSLAPLGTPLLDRQGGTAPLPYPPGAHLVRGEYQLSDEEREVHIYTETLIQPGLPTLAAPALPQSAKSLTRPHLPPGVRQSVHASTATATLTMPAKAQSNIPPTVASVSNALQNAVPLSQPARASRRKQAGKEELSPAPTKEPPEMTPAIQVTIGRIEVRAIPAPAAGPEKKPQAPSPPVMSLDDYLQHRTKGGHR